MATFKSRTLNSPNLKALFLFLFTLPLLLAGQDSLAHNEVFSLLTQLHDTIVHHHPIGYETESRQEMKSALERVNKELETQFAHQTGDSMAVPDFIYHAAALQTASGCGHLQLRPVLDTATLSAQRRHARYLGLFPIGNGSRYALNDTTLTMAGQLLESGTEVIRFEGEPIHTLITRLSAFQGLNDLGYDRATNYKLSVSLWAYYQNYYGYRDSLQFTIIDPETEAERVVWIDTRYRSPQRKKVPKKDRYKRYFKLRMSADSSAWVLRVRSFGGKAFEHVNEARLFKKTFATIRESGINKLVLDLRSNGGGSLERAKKFCRYLAKEDFQFTESMYSQTPTAAGTNLFSKMGYFIVGGVRKKGDHFEQPGKVKVTKARKDGFKGELVIIVNEQSFSATVMVAHVLKETGGATVIGGKTGGSRRYTYGGNIRGYVLGERLKFRVRIPNWRFEQYRPGEGTFTPDEIVLLNPESLRAGEDVRMERALEILGGELNDRFIE